MIVELVSAAAIGDAIVIGKSVLAFVVGAFQRLFETPAVAGAKTGNLLWCPSQFRFSPVMLGLKVVIASARPVRLIEAGAAHLRLLIRPGYVPPRLHHHFD